MSKKSGHTSLRFGTLAVNSGVLSERDLLEALQKQEEMKNRGEYRPLGALLVDLGKLTVEQLDDLLNRQCEAWEGSRTLGKYRLMEKIGEGGMGSVWKAVHTDLGNTVAIKLLPRAVIGDEVLVDRFQREARVLATINHTNIVQAFDAGEEDGQPYFVMPYLSGASLGEVMRKCRRLGVRTTLSIALQIVRGLQYAHDHGLVHRDLKPDNVALTNDGTVKILDLGLTKLMEETATQIRAHTKSGHIVGTPEHMAPEQVLGDPNLDGRADIYSLGSTMFQMLCGRVPFSGKSIAEVLRSKLERPPPDPKDFSPDLALGIRKLLLSMMARKPEDRPRDCRSIEVELEKLLEGKAITGSNLSPGSIVLGHSEQGLVLAGSTASAKDQPKEHWDDGNTRVLRSPNPGKPADPSSTTMMRLPKGFPDRLKTQVIPRSEEQEISKGEPTRAINAESLEPVIADSKPVGNRISRATTIILSPDTPAKQVDDRGLKPSRPANEQAAHAAPDSPSAGRFVQAVAAVILVIVTVLVTLAVVRMIDKPTRSNSPERTGSP